ncbi:MAG: hypothetical protein EOO91_00360 [Pedobacter sp.]|nr:MAG: hypothetical protein EOO91_00360 [Pedobacter sp.]
MNRSGTIIGLPQTFQPFSRQNYEQSIFRQGHALRVCITKIFPARLAREVFLFAKPCLENGLNSGELLPKDWNLSRPKLNLYVQTFWGACINIG